MHINKLKCNRIKIQISIKIKHMNAQQYHGIGTCYSWEGEPRKMLHYCMLWKDSKVFQAEDAYSLSEAGSDSDSRELSSESSASELDESMRCARAASDEGTVRRESGISSISSSDSEPPCTQVTNGDERITNSY